MEHIRGAPNHPQTQGKIERWHQTLKNRMLLDNYYLPSDLQAHIDRFVDHYNHHRSREPAEPGTGRCLLRTRPDHPASTRKDKTRDHQTTTIAASQQSRLS
jgi:putative transposase